VTDLWTNEGLEMRSNTVTGLRKTLDRKAGDLAQTRTSRQRGGPRGLGGASETPESVRAPFITAGALLSILVEGEWDWNRGDFV